MSDLIQTFFGEGKDLNALQMSDRAIIMFFIALILIRIAGRRAFGSRTAFDNIIAIMLGAILSRPVVGASPFLPTVVAALVLVFIYRVFAFFSVDNDGLSHFLKGKSMLLYKDEKFNKRNMKLCSISEGDLMEGIRLKGITSIDDVEEVYMERSGHLSVIKKDN